MARISYLFKKIASAETKNKPFYYYCGYYCDDNKRQKDFPVSLYFGKDEIAIYYKNIDKKVLKIFSLYVADGNLNQNMLSKKVEDYAHMPLWPTPLDEEKEKDLPNLYVSERLLATGFFANYYGFAFEEDEFIRTGLPTSHNDDVISIEGNKGNQKNKLIFKLPGNIDSVNGEKKDTWIVENKKIKASKINFLKILLDFLYELEFGTTFEGENFFRLQPCLQNNLVLDALTRQCRYLSELRKLEGFESDKGKMELPKPFRDAEREWLNVCRLEQYRPVFVSPHSLFQDPEKEVKKVFFETRIGKGRRDRREYLKNREDADLKNDICAFFMRKYDLISAFLVLLPRWCILLMVPLIIMIPIGDLIIVKYNLFNIDYAGLFSIIIPCVLVFSIFGYLTFRRVNLFKLLLPRLFLGIMMGWAFFWNTEELWKLGFTINLNTLIPLNIFIFIIIFIYLFTDISNQVYRKDIGPILKKSFSLIGMAVFISLTIGFYVIQFYADPLLENSGMLGNQRFYNEKTKENFDKLFDEIDKDNDKSISFKEYFDFMQKTKSNKQIKELYQKYNINREDLEEIKTLLRSKYRYLYLEINNGKYLEFENYTMIKLFPWGWGYICYIWSVLAFEVLVAILFGIVLQLIWEDRPITEPL